MNGSSDPRGDYPRQHSGEAGGPFEVDARTWSQVLKLATSRERIGAEPDPLAGVAVVVLDVSKPDPRLSLELSIGLVPMDAYAAYDVMTNAPNGQPVTVNMGASRVWLSLLADDGGGVRESEDIIGTRAVPVAIFQPGLWGVTYECDLDCIGVRAALRLAVPWVAGHYTARARWTALEPMSQRDWEHARQNLTLTVTPRLPTLLFEPGT